jgi:hypothetical protein
MKEKLKVINLFAGPGSGKTTTSALVFGTLKQMGINAEFCSEWVKGAVWEQRLLPISDQGFILGNQNYALHRLRGQVDVAITDSPLLLSPVYAKLAAEDNPYKKVDWDTHARSIFDTYDNLNIFIVRNKPYNPKGRGQTEQEARDVDLAVEKYLFDRGVPYEKVVDGTQVAKEVIEKVFEKWTSLRP